MTGEEASMSILPSVLNQGLPRQQIVAGGRHYKPTYNAHHLPSFIGEKRHSSYYLREDRPGWFQILIVVPAWMKAFGHRASRWTPPFGRDISR